MNLEELLQELQALIDKYAEGTPEDVSEEQAEQDAERMTQLSDEIERITGEQAQQRDARNAALANARSAIARGNAVRVDNVPLGRSASAAGGIVRDVTDYEAAYSRAWLKDVAQRGGIQLAGGTDMTTVERAAFTHTTENTGAVIPKEIQGQIISLIDNSAVLFGDAARSEFKHQFEIPRHTGIESGDAGTTDEGKAPSDDEKNTFDTVSLTGEEIKKTVKLSRKMAVQSMDGFKQYLINEVSARLSVAANTYVHAQLATTDLGIAAANKIQTAAAEKLAKADILKLLSLLKTFGNPAPKGAIFYANNDMIWNYIAMIEDANGRSYFVDEKTDDPTVQGRIFGKLVKQDDSMADGKLKVGFPDLIKGNMFDGPDVTAYVATDGSQKHCFDGYMLYDCGLVVPQAFGELTIKPKASGGSSSQS